MKKKKYFRCERPPPPLTSLQRRPACPQGYRYHPIWRRCSGQLIKKNLQLIVELEY